METRHRWLLSGAALLLLLTFLFPIWLISLEAPQYPEGIGLEIWTHTIQGQKQHDLNNINNLNHYIGMKRIEPDAIPELRWMPWIIGGLIVLGLGAAWTGKRALLYTWVGLFLIASFAGLVDFYLWEYDYGHNLDQETAIIKIPGMNYQPPLIGSKQLLNFTAHSWPGPGGWAAFLSLGIGLWLALRNLWPPKRSLTHVRQTAVAAALVLGLAACTPAPEPIAYGAAVCTHCQMKISDARYGAVLVTSTGKNHAFDALECLASHLQNGGEGADRVHSLWVADFSRPAHLLPVDSALILHSPQLHSPMGGNLAAFSAPATPVALVAEFGGAVISWPAVQKQTRRP